MRWRKGKEGWTLIELVLVLVVVGILSTVVGLSLQSYGSIKLNNAVDKVVGDLRYAQQLAISTQIRHGLTVNSASQYTVHSNGTPDVAIQDPVNLGVNFVVNFDTYQHGELTGVTFTPTTPFCGGANGVMEFNSVGAPTDTNGNLLTCTSTITLSYSGSTKQITIAPNTGNLTY
jgi:prepilin-type N-terminal cleavage/methylation domain-containing protein